MTLLDLSQTPLGARTFLTPQARRVELVQVGCGGTGSWLAPKLARIAQAESAREVSILLIDPDTIEAKNVGRQNFCPAEIGLAKSVALSRRLALAYGVNARALIQPFATMPLPPDTLRVYLGCVDNAPARRTIHQALALNGPDRAIWIDGGNAANGGQVIAGNATTRQALKQSFVLAGYARRLPDPALLLPNLVSGGQKRIGAARTPSCAEAAQVNVQSMLVNDQVALIMAGYLSDLLAGALKRFKTSFDGVSGTMQSLYITPERIAVSLARRTV